jgi:integrase
MAPPRKGNVEPYKRADGTTYFRARIRLADGSRERVDVPAKYSTPAGGKTARERAELYAMAEQEREDETGELLARRRASARRGGSADETCTGYFERLAKQRAASGVGGTKDERWTWNKWIAPRIGTKQIRKVTSDQIEDVRDALDDAVRKYMAEGPGHGASGKTALNAWSILRTTFKEARASRDRRLRVRADDPSAGIKPPLRTDERKKTFFYPVEALELLGCAGVPREWREVYAVALYTYARPNELRALRWSDVDLEHGGIHVTKAWDKRSSKVGAPKTANGVRDIPIERSLLPLLTRMRKGATASDLVLPLLAKTSDYYATPILREHLKIAGVTRARLTEDTATVMPINFRSCRDSGITWLAIAGVELARMQRRAGHDSIETTLGYVKQAEDITGTIGEPFPPLPESLVWPDDWAKSNVGVLQLHVSANQSRWADRDSNPGPTD